MTIHFDPLINKKQAITYIDDTSMQSQTRGEMFTIINESHTLLRKATLKSFPRQDVFLSEENTVPGTRCFTRWDSTNSKTRRCLTEPQVTPE